MARRILTQVAYAPWPPQGTVSSSADSICDRSKLSRFAMRSASTLLASASASPVRCLDRLHFLDPPVELFGPFVQALRALRHVSNFTLVRKPPLILANLFSQAR